MHAGQALKRIRLINDRSENYTAERLGCRVAVLQALEKALKTLPDDYKTLKKILCAYETSYEDALIKSVDIKKQSDLQYVFDTFRRLRTMQGRLITYEVIADYVGYKRKDCMRMFKGSMPMPLAVAEKLLKFYGINGSELGDFIIGCGVMGGFIKAPKDRGVHF